MTERTEAWAFLGAAGAAFLLWVWWINRQTVTPSQVIPAITPAAPPTDPNAIPPSTYNLTFQVPQLNPLGNLGVYIPTFGYVGIKA
jgi:hypothetical protein